MRSRKLTGIILGSLFALNAASAGAQGVVVQVRPPHSVSERRGRAPGRDYVWINGYQRWDGNHYAWTPGRWEVPPKAHARWVEPRWDKRGRGWAFTEGHWR